MPAAAKKRGGFHRRRGGGRGGAARSGSASKDPPYKGPKAPVKRVQPIRHVHPLAPQRKRKQGLMCPHVNMALLDHGEANYREIVDLFVIPSSKCLLPWDPKQSRLRFRCESPLCQGGFQFACCHCKKKFCRDHINDHAADSNHGCAIDAQFGYLACFLCNETLVQMEKCAKIWRDHRLKAVYETALRYGWLQNVTQLTTFMPDELRDACENRQALIGVHGIVNLSNTCCLNVILQAFCHTPLFRDFCLARLHRCNPNMLGFNQECVMCAFTSMIYDLYILPAGQCYAPQLIFQAVQNSLVNHGSELGEQEDPAEIINLLLNDMHLQSEHDGRKISPSLGEQLHLAGREMASMCVAQCIYCPCIVCDLFSGVEEYTTTCLQCKQDRFQGNSFKLLMLPIREDKPVEAGQPADRSLEDCLKMYTDAQLTSEVKNECCIDVKGAYRTNKFRHLPVVLIIQLKRAVAKNVTKTRIGDGDLKKNKEHIQFPLCLDMSPYMAEQHSGSTKYVLYGVVVHKGVKLSSGHYVCYIKHMSGRWLCMDDRAVFCCSESQVLSLQAYMLFYVLETVEFTVASASNIGTSVPIPPPIPSTASVPDSLDSLSNDELIELAMPPPLKVDEAYIGQFDYDTIHPFTLDHTYGKLDELFGVPLNEKKNDYDDEEDELAALLYGNL
ncbi:ubiquitin carboxyl-terminal hydrolase nonstop-like [Paramacrobiotus metropolitanus]|uniref:ubiquitin carboxyl-terminal hydrolase nonstop-like n=1 Tax=Paramacrobiotus metropolitanus TaxID=2943436 RepID=UPI00244622D4|nr:ubiquitin carboxyl-terminal hydrolase nonstop-like [Paramacrobiotus metropolitanus]